MRRFPSIPALALVVLILVGCSGESEPRIERVDASRVTPVLIDTWNIDGTRDGARTRAVTTWKLVDGEQLHVELVFAYDPEPVLAEGRWLSGSGGGSIEAEAVRFVGGQGEGPSVGGRFVLRDGGQARYRLHLPLTRIETGVPEL